MSLWRSRDQEVADRATGQENGRGYVQAVHGIVFDSTTCLEELTVFRTVQLMSYLPLKGISRLWGRFNELEIPYYLRVPGFKLYSWIFGVKYVQY